MSDRPEFVKDAHLRYLDELRESGITNMYGAAPYLRNAYRKLTEDQSVAVLLYWMRTFAKRRDEAQSGATSTDGTAEQPQKTGAAD